MGFQTCLVGAVFGVLAASAAIAQPTVWECSFAKGSGQGWIAPSVIVAHDAADGTATVVDGVIDYFVGTPLPAKVSADNSARTTFTWKFMSRDGVGQNATMQYRLTIQKADRSARMTAQALGYVGPYFASGRCRRLQG